MIEFADFFAKLEFSRGFLFVGRISESHLGAKKVQIFRDRPFKNCGSMVAKVHKNTNASLILKD